MYLVYCSIVFALLSLYKPLRKELIIMSLIALLTGLSNELLDNNGDFKYWLRAIVTFAGASALCYCRSFFGYYQASIYALTLALYFCLARDVAFPELESWVWGQRYTDMIHGLVACEFIGFLPVVWAGYNDWAATGFRNITNLLRSKRGFKS